MEKENNADIENNIENKFKIVSKIYGKGFKTVTFVVFNSDTGELKKQMIDNELCKEEVSEEVSYSCKCVGEQHECEVCKHNRGIRAGTAKDIQHEIKELAYGYPNGEHQHGWNHALITAAECCNGYELED